MRKKGRLFVVLAVVAGAAVIGSSISHGDGNKNANGPIVLPRQPQLQVRDEPVDEVALARSKFEQGGALTYQALKGDTYFALQVQPKLPVVAERPRDILVLVSNSATQAGSPWVASGQITEAIIKLAKPADRIHLFTVSTPDDKATRSLTRDFLAPVEDAKKLADALNVLRNRHFPAGDTDLKNGLRKALGMFDGQVETRQRILLFLGDGQSTHNPMTNADRQALCKEMVERKILFMTVPLGLHMDANNLHGLATGTGGMVVRVDLGNEKLDDAMKRFQTAFAQPVLYPTRFQLPADVLEYFPQKLPPLRSDSPTLVVGRLKATAKLAYTVEGRMAGNFLPVSVSNTETVRAAELDNYFLVSMVNQWKRATDEPALIRADRALAFAYEQNRLNHMELIVSGQLAVQEDKLAAAEDLFQQAKQLAPHDRLAQAGLKIVADLRGGRLTREMLRDKLANRKVDIVEKKNGQLRWDRKDFVQIAQLDPDNAEKAGDPKPKAGEREDLLQQQRDRMIVEEQKMTQAVEENLRQARRELATSPDAALDRLRNTLLRLRDHPDLGDQVRNALLSRVDAALTTVSKEGKAIKLRDEQRRQILEQVGKERQRDEERKTEEERIAAQYRVFKNVLNLARVEEKTRQEVVQGLTRMEEEARLKGQAPPVVARAAYDEVQASYNLNKYNDLKKQREKQFLEVYLSVEKSHVPFSDEPGIYFPPLAMWNALTELRKEKYEVFAIPDSESGRREANAIQKMMEEKIDMKDFQNPMSLKEGLQLLYEKMAAGPTKQELPILVDTEAFKEANPDAPDIYDTPIKFPPFPRYMTIATALRLALSQVPEANATYLIRRNFIEVTTIDRQTHERVSRVYPVGDLVIPINSMGGMMMSMGGGGMMMMGGGMMGMMGMGGGGMMMGMGGGMQMMGMGGMQMMGMGGGGMMMGMGGGMNMMGMGGMNMMGMGGGMMMGMGGGMNMMGMGGGMNMMGMGGMQMMGMGGMQMMGMGGMQMMGMGGMQMMGMGGGMQMMGMGGGMQMMGMGGQMVGGTFMGGFNGSLGMMGATQAPDLINIVTRLVAPGEWFFTQQPNPFQPQMMGAMGVAGVAGVMGPAGVAGVAGNVGGGNFGVIGAGAPPVPVGQGGPANIQDANTIEFFPPALALIIRAPSRVHYSDTGGLTGKAKRVVNDPFAQAVNDRGLDVAAGPGVKNPKVQVADAGDAFKDDKTKSALVKNTQPKEKIDPETIWQEALAKEKYEPGVIIATVDFLFDAGQHLHVAEFLKANLRQGIVVRPWVYEALALALERGGGDPEEIRRARLSAIALNPHDAYGFLEAADTMAKHKEWDRAVAFCRQAALLEPGIADTYANALTYAEQGRDSQAMEWAAERLLTTDWPIDNNRLHLKAQAKAENFATVLDQENRRGDAEKLRTAIRKLTERDLVINLTWGNGAVAADVDLTVKEPCGSVASIGQRQTPGGGTLLATNLTQTNSVSYTASKAFAGDYEITVQRNWGQPLGNRATLEIIQHAGTPKQVRRLEIVSLDRASTIKLKVDEGRRFTLATVPPPAVQTARREEPIDAKSTGTVMAHLRDLAFPDFAGAKGQTTAPTMFGNTGTPGSRLPSAPINQKQPEHLEYQMAVAPAAAAGVNWNAQAAVSADHRYIRLSMNPVFQSTRMMPAINMSPIPGGILP